MQQQTRQPYRIPRGARPFVAAAFILILLAAAFALYRWYQAEDRASRAGTGAVVAISATDLARAFDEDPIGADIRFDDSRLRVTGTMTALGAGVDGPVITLGGPDPLLFVTADFDRADTQRLAQLPVGQPVTVVCTDVSLVTTSPALIDCSLPQR